MSSQDARSARVISLLAGSSTPMTVPELAAKLGCSEVSVRRSLRELAGEGRVAKAGILPRHGLGGKLLWGRGRTVYAAVEGRTAQAG